MRMWIKRTCIVLFAVLMTALLPSFCLAALPAKHVVQSEPTDNVLTEKEEIIYRDRLHRDTPRGTVEGILSAMRTRDYALAAQYFDLQNIPEQNKERKGAQLARQLRIVLDQNIQIDPEYINDTYEGRSDDGLLPSQEIIGVIKSDKEVYDLILERNQISYDHFIWELSAQTVKDIPAIYEIFGFGVLGNYFPEILFEYSFFKITFAEWISVLVLIVGLFIVIFIPTQLIYYLAGRSKSESFKQFIATMLWPLRWIFVILVGDYIFDIICFSVTARSVARARTLFTISLIWFLLRLSKFFFMRWRQALRTSGKEEKAVLVTLLQKMCSGTILLLAAAVYLENLGFKITTIITGLGISGIAVALAAQKSIEDLFGAITILSSSPIKVGDFIRIEGTLGTVEEIGIRFTQLRTLERTLLNIPNSKIAGMNLDNLTHRDKFLFRPQIGVRLDTTASQLRYVLMEIRKMFYSHPKVHILPARIRLEEFSPYAAVLKVFLYIKANDYDESLAVAEDLNFRIKAILEKAGVQMAYPTRTTVSEQGVLPQKQEAERIHQEMQERANEGKLFIPDFPYEEISKLDGTITYPPDPANVIGE